MKLAAACDASLTSQMAVSLVQPQLSPHHHNNNSLAIGDDHLRLRNSVTSAVDAVSVPFNLMPAAQFPILEDVSDDDEEVPLPKRAKTDADVAPADVNIVIDHKNDTVTSHPDVNPTSGPSPSQAPTTPSVPPLTAPSASIFPEPPRHPAVARASDVTTPIVIKPTSVASPSRSSDGETSRENTDPNAPDAEASEVRVCYFTPCLNYIRVVDFNLFLSGLPRVQKGVQAADLPAASHGARALVDRQDLQVRRLQLRDETPEQPVRAPPHAHW